MITCKPAYQPSPFAKGDKEGFINVSPFPPSAHCLLMQPSHAIKSKGMPANNAIFEQPFLHPERGSARNRERGKRKHCCLDTQRSINEFSLPSRERVRVRGHSFLGITLTLILSRQGRGNMYLDSRLRGDDVVARE